MQIINKRIHLDETGDLEKNKAAIYRKLQLQLQERRNRGERDFAGMEGGDGSGGCDICPAVQR